ncbi:MAG TPA: LamG domain-containing protein [Solirubrobacterales bacterium]|nr:LamG domain-containing protein [Solirubrobacterales bacterium]
MHFSKNFKPTIRSFFAALVLVAFGAFLTSSASAAIVNPVPDSASPTSPVDFRGDASLNFLKYSTDVHVRLYYTEQVKENNPFGGLLKNRFLNQMPVGSGEDALDIDGDWNIHMADITDRKKYVLLPTSFPDYFQPSTEPLPDGAPLQDGKYDMVARQFNIELGNIGADPDDPVHNTWVAAFWIDSGIPDTVIDTVTPPGPSNTTSRDFTFHAQDATPLTSSGTFLECRIDGGTWEHCDHPDSDPSSPTRAGIFSVDDLTEGVHTFEARATDMAGNVDPTPAKTTFLVDQTKPTITLTKPAMRERFTLGQHVPSVFTCDDPPAGNPPGASGIKTCSGPSTVDTSRLGNFRFVVNAEDHAGNTHQVVHSYAVDPPKYADVINGKGPIAYYRLGDQLGSDPMADSSGNHNDGEFKNGIALRQPPAPSCHIRPHAPYTCDLNADPQDFSAFFPARDGYGFTNNIVAPKSAYTIEAWINRADDKAGSVMGQGGGGQLFVTPEGKLALRQTQDTVYSEGPVLTPNTWWHVAATWNGQTTKLYVNGNLVGSSSTANKPPSGTSTLYVGYGDQAPWFHGYLDEAAYYGSALSAHDIWTRYHVGTAKDVPSPAPDGPPIQRPSADIHQPNNGGLYARTKVPPLHFSCDDLDGFETVASCTATVDGVPIANEGTLPDSPGEHTVVVTAIDSSELIRTHTHKYTVKSFEDIYNDDAPIAYYRLGDANGAPMKDSGPAHRDGTYKNGQESGPVGISGDGDRARRFHGASGYGFVSSIPAPKFQSTIEVWANPDDQRRQSIVGHGDAGEIFVGEDGVLSFRHMGTTVSTSPGLTPGRFTQVVGVWDGVNISLYVDGEFRASAEATKRPSSSSTFYVGFGEIQPWFKGSLDEVAYYGKALSPNRILEHFLADPPPGDADSSETPDPPVDPKPPVDPETPADPDTPVSSDDPPVGDPAERPVGREDDPRVVESGSGSKAGNGVKANAKARALKKCKKIKKKSKRKACIKRVSR